MKYVSIILLLMIVYTTGCAHRSAGTPLGEQPALSSTYNKVSAPLPEKQTPSGRENEKETFLDKDLDTLYEEAEAGVVRIADPIAPFNRAMFYFNDKFYFWLLKPVAKGYRYLIPAPVRIAVKNFFQNLTTPVRLVNCVLQGKGNAAAIEFARFVMNSTLGVLGFGSPADDQPHLARPDDEDLNQTLGKYGIGNGFYIVWPILGPSTLRDTFGRAGDWFLNPINYIEPREASLGVWSFDKVNQTSFRIGDYETIKAASLDPYSAIRDAYIQYTEKKTQK